MIVRETETSMFFQGSRGDYMPLAKVMDVQRTNPIVWIDAIMRRHMTERRADEA